jgi:hypothetical protein
MRSRNYLHIENIWVHSWVFGGVRVAHLLSFFLLEIEWIQQRNFEELRNSFDKAHDIASGKNNSLNRKIIGSYHSLAVSVNPCCKPQNLPFFKILWHLVETSCSLRFLPYVLQTKECISWNLLLVWKSQNAF